VSPERKAMLALVGGLAFGAVMLMGHAFGRFFS
jgi:hypothetical protein